MIGEKSEAANTSPSYVFAKYATDGFMFLSFLYVSLRVLWDYRTGGDEWKQGDWLINNSEEHVRRGPLGSAIISISDHINSSPLFVVSAIQIILLAILFIAFRLLVTQIRNPQLWALIIISPAIFTVFWVADPQGSVRKELIAFAGLSLYALAAVRENWLLLWLGVAIFCMSVVSHEAMVLFTPTFFAIILVTELHKTAAAQALSSTIIVSCFSLFLFLLAIGNAQAVDTSAICAPLIERGLDESICGGAIKWLSYDSSYGFNAVISVLSIRRLGGFLISYAAALAPFLYIIWIGRRRIESSVILIMLGLPFVPLYFVAVDWGRWMSFHIFSAAILLSCALAKDNFPIQRNPSNLHVFRLAILAFLISPQHTIGITWAGAARRALTEFWRLLG